MSHPALWVLLAAVVAAGQAFGGEHAQAEADETPLLDEELEALDSDTAPSRPSAPSGVQMANVPLDLAEPLTFSPADPLSRAGARLMLGAPGYASVLPFFEWGLDRRLSVGAVAGFEQTGGLVRAGARYALVKSRARAFYLSAGAHLGLRLGGYSYPEARAELGLGKRFGDRLDLQGLVWGTLTLGGANPEFGPAFLADAEWGASAQAAVWITDEAYALLESNSRLEGTTLRYGPVESTRQVFSTLTVGGRYAVTPDVWLGAGLTFPVYHQFRSDLTLGGSVGATWIF